MKPAQHHCDIAIIGAGPSGLAAAEVAAKTGLTVHLYERMPTPARKLLMAGKSGLNITHSEPYNDFLSRYGNAQTHLEPALDKFAPSDITAWMNNLGSDTFTGSSGRVFPKAMKASPLLRNWLQRLDQTEVKVYTRHQWLGWDNDGCLKLAAPQGECRVHAKAVILALGGISWPKLGSVGEWTGYLTQAGVTLSPFQPTNCGFNVRWSNHFKTKYAGEPIKNVMVNDADTVRKGDFVITEYGIEGSLVYSVSSQIFQQLTQTGTAALRIDMAPEHSLEKLRDRLRQPRGKRSFSNYLRKQVGLHGVKVGLLYEFIPKSEIQDPETLAQHIKAMVIPIHSPRPIEEAISVAGGVTFESMDENLMLNALPGVFCAGEMTDWEAPTGGYLLSACLAQGRQAARGAIKWLKANDTNTGI